MRLHPYSVLSVFLCFVQLAGAAETQQPRMLPGERSADAILNGDYPYPPSPKVDVHQELDGLAKDRLSKPPAPGVHPRVLISPDDLPDLRRRVKETNAGKALLDQMRQRVKQFIATPNTPGNDLYEQLVSGNTDAAMKVIQAHPELLGTLAHYAFYMPDALACQSLVALIDEDEATGKKVAAALATWSKLIQPTIQNDRDQPLGEDMFRVTPMPNVGDAGPTSDLAGKSRDLLGYQEIGYAYDFAYGFMTDEQRSIVRHTIATATNGRVWMGCELPHHFRNWNWIAIGLSQPLLALSIEGEEGYDPRVYRMGVEIANDYFSYGITANGVSTEAVGYTQFGLNWGNAFSVAASRRGDLLVAHSHLRHMLDWYIQTQTPAQGEWTSHGDGGDAGAALWSIMMARYFYPDDARADFLWQGLAKAEKAKLFNSPHLIEPLLWASDPKTDKDGKPVDYAGGAALKAPLTLFDPTRSSLVARSGWDADAAMMEFECRTDSVGASHEHADRGSFTFSALGRDWAKEFFRSIETRHHNAVLVDGLGQGYWPGPGKWLGLNDAGWAVMAACDAKPAYDWWWPKEIISEDPDTFIRFHFPRWMNYAKESKTFHANYLSVPTQRDDRPSVVAHWKGFDIGDPRMWDEDAWPVRLPHNPVQRAFRTVTFVQQGRPYLLVCDDIQKDDQERLYEWLMQTGSNTEMVSIKDNDIILADATSSRDANGSIKPKKGERELLVRVLDCADPATAHEYQAKPSIRLEAYERKDTLAADGRTYGLDKRLVIPSRSVAPRFKVLLFPFREGDPVPQTTWDAAKKVLTVKDGDQSDTFTFEPGADGRTHISGSRPGQSTVELK